MTAGAAVHVHRWRLPEPAGAYCIGRCDCGAERKHCNVFEPDLRDAGWKRTEGRKAARLRGARHG